jgi:hypothetical protein
MDAAKITSTVDFQLKDATEFVSWSPTFTGQVRAGRPDGFVQKNYPKCSPIHIFLKINTERFLRREYPKIGILVGIMLNNTQNKQPPKRRKFAQSGHRDYGGRNWRHTTQSNKNTPYVAL